jgi:RNA polymerase sigma-70 factor (sigma-E family)
MGRQQTLVAGSERGGNMEPGKENRDAAFTAWVRAQRPLLTRTAFLLCGDPHLAEDLVQTSLTRLYLAWPRVAEMQSPNAYARQSILNAHIDMTRRAWWSRERQGLDMDGRAAAATPRQHDTSDQSVERAALVEALRGLSPGQRRVVVLRHLWDLSVRETAAELGCSEGTVKSQDSAALRHLRALLSPPAPVAPDLDVRGRQA